MLQVCKRFAEHGTDNDSGLIDDLTAGPADHSHGIYSFGELEEHLELAANANLVTLGSTKAQSDARGRDVAQFSHAIPAGTPFLF